MTSKILRSTERGQITLPKQWRSHFTGDTYLATMLSEKLIITPLQLDELAKEEVLFDADRDNVGKGVSPDEMIRALRKIKHG